MKLEIYEKNIYGIKGLVSSKLDEESLRIRNDLTILKNEFKSLEVSRYEVSLKSKNISSLMNINKDIKEYSSINRSISSLTNLNEEYNDLISKANLPIVLVNGEVLASGKYPTLRELKECIKDNIEKIKCI